MKAAVLLKPGNLEIRDVPVPPCPPDGVLINVKACGICSADTKMVLHGHRALRYPRILGHEIAGVVSESRVREFKPGDRVQVAPGLRCGNCIPCGKGADNQCEHREILGFTRDGGFAQYLAIPLQGKIMGCLTRLPDNVTYGDATLGEPMACCINAQEKISIASGDTVLIVGAGLLGLLHCVVARTRGAEKILVAEIQADRRSNAVNSYAHQAFDPQNDGFFQSVMEVTHQKGVDAIIFACSEAGLDETYINLMAPGGRVSLFSGTSPPQSRLALDANIIHYNEMMISGSYGCTARQNEIAIDLIASAMFTPGELITHRVSFGTIDQGLGRNATKALKSILEVDDE